MSRYHYVRTFCFTCLRETAHRREAPDDANHGKLVCEECVYQVEHPVNWVTAAIEAANRHERVDA